MLMLVAMVPSLSAQVQLTITPDTSSTEVQTNRNAQTATPGSSGAGLLVTGSLIANSPLTTTRLRIVYPGPITSSDGYCTDPNNLSDGASGFGATIDCQQPGNNGAGGAGQGIGTGNPANCIGGGTPGLCATALAAPGIPTQDPLRVEGATGVFAPIKNSWLRLNTWSSRIEVLLPATAPTDVNTNSGSFRIVGVRIDANGKTGAQTISASLNGGANNYLLATSTGTIINNLSPGIASMAIGTAPGNTTIGAFGGGINSTQPPGAATIFTNRSVPRSVGSFIITEGCASCWRTAAQSGNSGSALANGANIRLTFNNLPAGVTLNLAPSTGNSSANAALKATLNPTQVTASTNTATISFTGTSTASIETIEIDYQIVTPLSTTAAVTTPGSVSVTATMYPLGDGVNSIGVADSTTAAQGYPAFVEADVGPVTIVNIVAANTTMLMPYAFYSNPFDTGIAIANTTADPFGTGAGGATKSNGTLTLDFFPTTSTGGAGTPVTLTTSSTVKPGSGLSSDGTLAAGATWTVLLSQLLTAAGQTGGFTGYIFIRANFLDAHGTATISDFKTYSLASNVLVLPPPATTARDSNATGAEALDF